MPADPLPQMNMGVRRFGRVNWLGLMTLARRETMRFLAVWQQTLAAPLITAGLFLGVFTLALGQGRANVMGVSFVVFLAPGILMMTVIQNAFANTSSSLVSAKVMGNIVDTLMPPLSPLELVLGYLAGATVRGALVAGVIWVAVGITMGLWPQSAVWLLVVTEAGAREWRNCRSCHMIATPEGEVIQRGGGRGPNLWAVIGRPVAGVEGFRYSASLAAYGATGAVWTPETLAAFVTNPTGYLREVLDDSGARSEMGHRALSGADDLAAYLDALDD